MTVVPAAASREATKHAGLCAEVDGEGARNASPAVRGHHARHPLHERPQPLHTRQPDARRSWPPQEGSCRLSSHLSWLSGCLSRHSVSTNPGSEARPPKWSFSAGPSSCGLTSSLPAGLHSGLCGDNSLTSGMPTPRLMSWWGRVISSMARWPMTRRSSSGMGRMCEAGTRISALRDASCSGELMICRCLSGGATTICMAVPWRQLVAGDWHALQSGY